MTQQFNPAELTEAPMQGDSTLLKDSLEARGARIGRRGSKAKNDTSLYTQVVEEASKYGEELRSMFRTDAVAPIMKRKLSRAQVKQRILAMTPEQRMVYAKKFGRPFIKLAAQISGE